MHRAVRWLLILLVLAVATPAVAAEVRVSAAASVSDAVKEIAVAFTAGRPGTVILPNFGGSGILAKQIAQGAPADVFISASREWIDYLVSEKRLVAESVRNLAGNALVFVGRKGVQVDSLPNVAKLSRIAVGTPRSVPAGQYAEEALTRAGVYRQLIAGKKLVMAQDVRQALVYADRGEVDGAFVYQTDALLARNAVILFRVPAELHSPITCPMALTVRGANNAEAVAFFSFLQTSEAKQILTKHGFTVDQ